MDEHYILNKWVWSEADFSSMKWYENRIYALSFSLETYELLLDIDYIFEWLPATAEKEHYQFWIAPATLVFENVYEVELDSQRLAFEVESIERSDARRPRNAEYIRSSEEWRWIISCHDGDISFWSAGYHQYIRSQPVLSQTLGLGLDMRGGIAFAKGRTDVVMT